MKNALVTLDFRRRRQWRTWLAKHHASNSGIWLVFHKEHTGVKSIPYEDAVREALCFGWIDSLIKRLDDDRYARKFTPRKPTSKWSDLNRRRWTELKAAGLLAASGLAAAPTGNTYASRPTIPELPAYIAKALKLNPQAWDPSGNYRAATGAITSFGYTWPGARRHVRSEFENPLRCWRKAGSWA